MKRFLLLIPLLFSLSNAAGTYDGYTFTDTEEKYSVFWLNNYTTADLTATGLATADASAIYALRPLANSTPAQISSSLLSVANNTNITGTDMLRIREASHRIVIPPQSPFDDYNSTLGITVNEQNYLYGFTGLIVGAGFYFGFITIIARVK